MNLVFFGSGEFGVPTLASLHERHTLHAIITQPDKPAGRSRQPTPTPVAQWAAASAPSIPIFKPHKVNEAAQTAAIRAIPADAFVVIAFGQKLGRALLAERFAINLHASLLPRWRGAAPINAAMLHGDPVTGNSVITLADQMDAGLILAQSTRPVDPMMTAGELHDLLAADGPALVDEVLARHASRTIEPHTQDEAAVTIAGKLSKADGVLDFARPAEECRRRVHALTPWPGVTVTYRDQPLKLLRVQETRLKAQSAGVTHPPGTILDADAGIVRCSGDDALTLLEVQPASGKAMAWPDFARGRRVTTGDRLIGASG